MNKLYYCLTLILLTSGVLAETAPQPQECLGRLTFTQPDHFQWAVAEVALPLPSEASLSNGVSMPLDRWDYNKNTRVMVSKTTKKEAYTAQPKIYYPRLLAIKEATENVRVHKFMLENIKKTLAEKKAILARGEKLLEGYLNIDEQAVEETEEQLKQAEAELAALKNYTLPATYLEQNPETAVTIANNDTQRLFVWREPRLYMFYISNLFKPSGNPPATVEDAKKLLASFSTRALGEVPKQSGFCFPYGFIKDDGKPIYQIKNSFRFTDQPNVAYSINTGTDRYYLQSTPATQGLNTRPPKLVGPENFTPMTAIDQVIPLKNGNSLHLKGWQVTRKDPVMPRHYYVAYGDLTLNQQPPNPNLFVAIQIKAFGQDEKDGRPHYAPSFDIAVKRLMPLLESLQQTLDKSP